MNDDDDEDDDDDGLATVMVMMTMMAMMTTMATVMTLRLKQTRRRRHLLQGRATVDPSTGKLKRKLKLELIFVINGLRPSQRYASNQLVVMRMAMMKIMMHVLNDTSSYCVIFHH